MAAPPGPGSSQNKSLLIAAWVTAFLFPIVGLVLSIIGKKKGDPRFKPPLVVSIVVIAVYVLWFGFFAALFAGMRAGG